MSQHDYNLANQNGSASRSDLNNLFAAILTNNSGASEPSSMSAFQWWCDTANDLLKQRNAANSAWVTKGTLSGTYFGLLALSGGTMTGALLLAAGSLSACGIAFTGDANTGLYSSGADAMGFVAGGTEYLRITSTGGNFLGTGAVKIPVGTTAQRPTGAEGMIRRNTTTGLWEGYTGSAWGDLAQVAPNISSKTANYTTTDTDGVIYVDGTSSAFAITLHTPTFNQVLTIVRTDDDDLTYAVSITGTISGESDWKLHTKNESYRLQYSTSLAAWRLLAHNTAYHSVDTTMSITGSTSNPTKGTMVRDQVIIDRRGRYADLTYQYEQSALGAAGSGAYQFQLPHGLNALTGTLISDTAEFPYATSSTLTTGYAGRMLPNVSGFIYETDGTASYTTPLSAWLVSTSRFIVYTLNGGAVFGSANFPLSLATLGFTICIRVPIDGWKD